MKKCCICKESCIGFGNNPDPVKEKGRCCDVCNYTKVIPARIEKTIFKKVAEPNGFLVNN